MAFTVTTSTMTKDAEFESYVRLLRQQGLDIGNLPRVPDPLNPRHRWVYVWNTREDAQRFVNQLCEQTRNTGWRVVETAAPPSTGPFGPLLIQLARRSDGLLFALHPLSQSMIQEAAMSTTPGAGNAFISAQNWRSFQETQGGLPQLVEGILPAMTNLTHEQLTSLGYAVIDADTEETRVYVPPAEIIPARV